MKKGFTLIEMLVVMSIIGILAALTLVSYSGAQKQARDSERRSDLNQVRNALETFAGSNEGNYPSRPVRQPIATYLCSDLTEYLSVCLSDPGTHVYYYESDDGGGGGPEATQYVLAVKLETGDYWEVCSNGEVGKTGHKASVDNGPEPDCRVGEDLL